MLLRFYLVVFFLLNCNNWFNLYIKYRISYIFNEFVRFCELIAVVEVEVFLLRLYVKETTLKACYLKKCHV